MGLDQYLSRTNRDGTSTEVAYFRKVNFLHRWVTTHILDGRETNSEVIPLDLEQIAGLGQTCNDVLEHPELGPELLPTTSGFFFGSTDYDEHYLRDVEHVRDACVQILAYESATTQPGSGRYSYLAWW